MKNISNSGNFYTDIAINARNSFFKSHLPTDNTTALLIDYAVQHLNLQKKGTCLDIGTGNGYVLTEIVRQLKNIDSFELYGVDVSSNMVKEAEMRCNKYPQIKIIEADNNKLPFSDGVFDVVTNKLATNFSMTEVFRVLKKDGIFVFKEYGLFKGFGGISKLFADRMKIKDPLDYIRDLRLINPQSISYNQFFYERVFTKNELINIFTMAPIINNFSVDKDIKIIESSFKGEKIKVRADPFLIIAKK